MFQVGYEEQSFFITVKKDPIVVIPHEGLKSMVQVKQHSFWEVKPAAHLLCTGEDDCPMCQMGNSPRFRGFLSVEYEGQARVLIFGRQIFRAFLALEKEGMVKGTKIKLTREGSGLQTSYSAIPYGAADEIKTTAVPTQKIIDVLLSQQENLESELARIKGAE